MTRRLGRSIKTLAGILICMANWFAVFPEALHAQDASNPGIELDKSSVFTAQLENDLLGNGEDRHYTHGTRLSYISKEKPARIEGVIKEWIETYFPNFLIPETRRMSLVLGQNIFTPENIAERDLTRNDRPYAGWLYAGVGLMAETKSARRPYLDNLEINVGVVGPWAQAGETQTFAHELKDIVKPEGWDNQLDNEFGIVIYYERKWPMMFKKALGPIEFDVSPSLGGALGNVYTFLAGGGMARVGQDLPNDYGPPLISPGLSGSGFFKPHKDFTWYLFAGAQGRFMARNIFLDGNTFADSHSVDKKLLIGDFQMGVVFTLFRHIRLGFTNVFRSKEFDEQPEPDEFGSINLSFRW